jgi:hypothetical protein
MTTFSDLNYDIYEQIFKYLDVEEINDIRDVTEQFDDVLIPALRNIHPSEQINYLDALKKQEYADYIEAYQPSDFSKFEMIHCSCGRNILRKSYNIHIESKVHKAKRNKPRLRVSIDDMLHYFWYIDEHTPGEYTKEYIKRCKEVRNDLLRHLYNVVEQTCNFPIDVHIANTILKRNEFHLNITPLDPFEDIMPNLTPEVMAKLKEEHIFPSDRGLPYLYWNCPHFTIKQIYI